MNIVDDLKVLIDKFAAIMADVVSNNGESKRRLEDLERRVAALERSVVLMPGGNPTERAP